MEIPFFKPDIDETEKSLIDEVLSLKGEQKVELLEKKFQDYIGCKYAVSTNNGTAAKHLAMCALDLKRGDKLICSVNAFPSVAEVIRHFDAEPIFVDINKDDFNMDPKKLEEALIKHKHKKLKGVFVSHIAGQPAELDAIYELAQKYKVKVIEDASYAMGATYKGKKIGSLEADITVFSFNPQRMNAVAYGGIMVTDNKDLEERARLLKNHAIVSEKWDKYGNLGYVYDVVDIGCKYDISELNAAFCTAQLEKNDKFIQRRREIAKIYYEKLQGLPHIELPKEVREHNFDLFIIKIDKNRDGFARALKERGIYTGLHFIPLHLLSYYKHKYNLRVSDFPNALANYQQILSLPIYSALTNEEVEYICENVADIANKWI